MKSHETPSVDGSAYEAGAAFVEGEFIPISEARVPITDWGFLHSDATYDVAHVWRGNFFRLEDHLDRFGRGIAKLHMHPPYGREGIREVLLECVRLSGLRDAYAEMICTRGVPPQAHVTLVSARTAFTLSSYRLSGSPTPESKSGGCTPS